MTETSRPHTRLLLVGNFVHGENETIDVTIPSSSTVAQNLPGNPHPARELLSEPMALQPIIGNYGVAQSIDDLEGAVGEYPGLFWALFEIVATFPSAFEIDVDLDNQAVTRIYLGTLKGGVYGWWSKPSEVYITRGDNLPEADNATRSKNFNPGELMYAFSVMAEHIRLGSTRFSIKIDEAAGNVLVSFFDHEIRNFRSDTYLPLMPNREIETE